MKETTGIRIKRIMNERNLKQIDILHMCEPYCKRYGIKMAKNDLSQYVNDKVQPKQDKLSILGMALNISEAWLMGYDVPMDRDNDFSPSSIGSKGIDNTIKSDNLFNYGGNKDTEQALKLYEAYLKAIPEVQEAVENLLKSHLSDS